MRIKVDPGHGGADPGVIAHGCRECDTNLLAARALQAELLRYEGVTVQLTHDGNPVGLQGAQRAAMANAVGADLLISLHADASSSAATRGHHVIYSLHGDRRLAQVVSDSLVVATGRPAFRVPWTRALQAYPNEDWYAIIRNAKMPAIIVERGFMTNAEDAALMFDQADLVRQAAGIAVGIADYFGLRKVKEMGFKDVPSGHWAAGSINQAVSQGWVGGFPDGTFRPEEPVTRAQAVSMVGRATVYTANRLQSVIAKCKPAVVKVTSRSASGTVLGAGSIITPDGYILTNEHVVKDRQAGQFYPDLQVHIVTDPELYEATKAYPATVVATSNWDDLALIKVDLTSLPTLTLASKTPPEGTAVIAVGHPSGMQYTSSAGVVTQDMAVIGGMITVMQTDAAINPGNSGGPIVDLDGRVAAVAVSKLQDLDNVAFGVRIEDVRNFLAKHLPGLIK